MRTIEVTESTPRLPQLLEEVGEGQEITLTLNHEPIARIVPIEKPQQRIRRKVGELRGAPFHVPDSAFAPLTDSELKEWGL